MSVLLKKFEFLEKEMILSNQKDHFYEEEFLEWRELSEKQKNIDLPHLPSINQKHLTNVKIDTHTKKKINKRYQLLPTQPHIKFSFVDQFELGDGDNDENINLFEQDKIFEKYLKYFNTFKGHLKVQVVSSNNKITIIFTKRLNKYNYCKEIGSNLLKAGIRAESFKTNLEKKLNFYQYTVTLSKNIYTKKLNEKSYLNECHRYNENQERSLKNDQ